MHRQVAALGKDVPRAHRPAQRHDVATDTDSHDCRVTNCALLGEQSFQLQVGRENVRARWSDSILFCM